MSRHAPSRNPASTRGTPPKSTSFLCTTKSEGVSCVHSLPDVVTLCTCSKSMLLTHRPCSTSRFWRQQVVLSTLGGNRAAPAGGASQPCHLCCQGRPAHDGTTFLASRRRICESYARGLSSGRDGDRKAAARSLLLLPRTRWQQRTAIAGRPAVPTIPYDAHPSSLHE